MNTPRTQRLLAQAGRRLFLVRFGSTFRRAGLIAAGVAMLLLISSRLLGLLPATVIVPWLWTLAVAALAVTALIVRRPSPAETARRVDERTDSKDLFLTTTFENRVTGEYQPIVQEQAEQKAESIDPKQVVGFPWQRGTRDLCLSVALVAVTALWLPQFDPFKKAENRNKLAKQEKQLEQTKKATAMRSEQLKHDETKESDRVNKALAELEKTFKQAKPQEREKNLQRLAEQQKQIGEMWRQVANQKRNDSMDDGAQKFGQVNPKQTQQWKEDLKKGDTTAIKKEMEAIKTEMQKLSQMSDSAEKRAAQEQLAQRMNQLSEGLKQTASSSQLQSALQRAMEQLDMSKTDQLSKESLEAAQQSMNLSQQELDQLSQAMKDQQSLEDALKNLQMAKQLADQQKLDGEQCKDCQGQGDYAKLYEKLMKEGGGALAQGQGEGDGAGNGGMGKSRGRGQGGKAEENDESETAFKPERAPTQLAAGKTLLQWKTKEIGPTGERTEKYRDAVLQVKQGVSEAITAEQVPPGYHGAIQKYFDTLPEKAEK